MMWSAGVEVDVFELEHHVQLCTRTTPVVCS
jgi:hypothetical protein